MSLSVVRLQNLAWSASAADIRSFFHGCEIPSGGVHIIGGDKSECFVVFSDAENAKRALFRDGRPLNGESLNLYPSSMDELQYVVALAKGERAVKPVPTKDQLQMILSNMNQQSSTNQHSNLTPHGEPFNQRLPVQSSYSNENTVQRGLTSESNQPWASASPHPIPQVQTTRQSWSGSDDYARSQPVAESRGVETTGNTRDDRHDEGQTFDDSFSQRRDEDEQSSRGRDGWKHARTGHDGFNVGSGQSQHSTLEPNWNRSNLNSGDRHNFNQRPIERTQEQWDINSARQTRHTPGTLHTQTDSTQHDSGRSKNSDSNFMDMSPLRHPNNMTANDGRESAYSNQTEDRTYQDRSRSRSSYPPVNQNTNSNQSQHNRTRSRDDSYYSGNDSERFPHTSPRRVGSSGNSRNDRGSRAHESVMRMSDQPDRSMEEENGGTYDHDGSPYEKRRRRDIEEQNTNQLNQQRSQIDSTRRSFTVQRPSGPSSNDPTNLISGPPRNDPSNMSSGPPRINSTNMFSGPPRNNSSNLPFVPPRSESNVFSEPTRKNSSRWNSEPPRNDSSDSSSGPMKNKPPILSSGSQSFDGSSLPSGPQRNDSSNWSSGPSRNDSSSSFSGRPRNGPSNLSSGPQGVDASNLPSGSQSYDSNLSSGPQSFDASNIPSSTQSYDATNLYSGPQRNNSSNWSSDLPRNDSSSLPSGPQRNHSSNRLTGQPRMDSSMNVMHPDIERNCRNQQNVPPQVANRPNQGPMMRATEPPESSYARSVNAPSSSVKPPTQSQSLDPGLLPPPSHVGDNQQRPPLIAQPRHPTDSNATVRQPLMSQPRPLISTDFQARPRPPLLAPRGSLSMQFRHGLPLPNLRPPVAQMSQTHKPPLRPEGSGNQQLPSPNIRPSFSGPIQPSGSTSFAPRMSVDQGNIYQGSRPLTSNSVPQSNSSSQIQRDHNLAPQQHLQRSSQPHAQAELQQANRGSGSHSNSAQHTPADDRFPSLPRVNERSPSLLQHPGPSMGNPRLAMPSGNAPGLFDTTMPHQSPNFIKDSDMRVHQPRPALLPNPAVHRPPLLPSVTQAGHPQGAQLQAPLMQAPLSRPPMPNPPIPSVRKPIHSVDRMPGASDFPSPNQERVDHRHNVGKPPDDVIAVAEPYILVENLPPNVVFKQLRALFATHSIIALDISIDWPSDEVKLDPTASALAVCQFQTIQDAVEVLNELSGMKVKGKVITLKPSSEREFMELNEKTQYKSRAYDASGGQRASQRPNQQDRSSDRPAATRDTRLSRRDDDSRPDSFPQARDHSIDQRRPSRDLPSHGGNPPSHSNVSRERSEESRDRTNRSHERLNDARERPNESRDRESRERPNESRNRPNELRERSNDSRERSNELRNRPNESRHRPNESRHRPNDHRDTSLDNQRSRDDPSGKKRGDERRGSQSGDRGTSREKSRGNRSDGDSEGRTSRERGRNREKEGNTKETSGTSSSSLRPPSEQTRSDSSSARRSTDDCWVLMTGLPHGVSEGDILSSFNAVTLNKDTVTIMKDSNGECTGNAYSQIIDQDEKRRLISGTNFVGQTLISVKSVTVKDKNQALTDNRDWLIGASQEKGIYTLQLIGLPFEADLEIISQFLHPAKIRSGSLRLCLNSNNRCNGIAFVQVGSKEDRDAALKHDRGYIGRRYISVKPTNSKTMYTILKSQTASLQDKPASPLRSGVDALESKTVHMNNLRYDVKPSQIMQFFAGFEPDFDSIKFAMSNGMPTGRATVRLGSAELAAKAVKKLNRTHLVARPILLSVTK